MKPSKKPFTKHKIVIIILLLLIVCMILAMATFFVLRANSFQLLCDYYKFSPYIPINILDEDVVDGKEVRIVGTFLYPDSPLKKFEWGPMPNLTMRCEKNKWGFWELVDYSHSTMEQHFEYSWNYPVGKAFRDTDTQLYEYHNYYWGYYYLSDQPPQFLPGQIPENVSVSITDMNGWYLIHVSYVAENPIDFDVMGIMEENGYIIHDDWPENQLDESLFGVDVESLTTEEYGELTTKLLDLLYADLTIENRNRVLAEMERVGIEFLTDEQVKEKFPEAYYGMAGAELSANVVFKRLLLALMIAIPLIVIAIPFVIGPLAAKHRRKKEARQIVESEDS